jgi:hypothetical protein
MVAAGGVNRESAAVVCVAPSQKPIFAFKLTAETIMSELFLLHVYTH